MQLIAITGATHIDAIDAERAKTNQKQQYNSCVEMACPPARFKRIPAESKHNAAHFKTREQRHRSKASIKARVCSSKARE
jgi:hypothetical protein